MHTHGDMVAVAGLRAPEEQLWLSRLSQSPCVHLLASIDHVNAALLWDKRTAARYQWLWHNVTNYASYDVETLEMQPIITGNVKGSTLQCTIACIYHLLRSPESRHASLLIHGLL